MLGQGVSSSEAAWRPEVRKLTFTRLAKYSRGDGTDEHWKHENFEFDIKDFTMDPKQDLLVLFSTPP